ncbi:hypothetical protein MTO96_008244 [Rhipicephalus appendiculatus]
MYSIVVRTTYNTYQEARKNLDKAQYSDVESGDLQKRKVSKPSRYVSEDEMATFHSHPTVLKGSSTDELHEGGGQSQEDGSRKKGEMPKPSHTFSALLKPPSSFPSPSISTHVDSDTPAENTEDLSSDSHQSGEDCAMASPPARAKNRKALTPEEFQHEVLLKLTVLRMVQKQHGELLHGLIGRLRSNAAKGNPALVSSPFSEYESLKQFDDKLTGQMKDIFVEELANKGGINAAACTKRILCYLLCDNLAAEFSGKWLRRVAVLHVEAFKAEHH